VKRQAHLARFAEMFLSAVADEGANPTDAFEAAAMALESAEFYEALDGNLAILEEDIARSSGLPPCGPAARRAALSMLEASIRRDDREIRHAIRLSLAGLPEDDWRRKLLPGDLYRSTFIPSQELVEPGTGGGPTNPVADFASEPKAPRVGKVKARGRGRGRHRPHRRRLGKALRVPRKWRELS
jgi:hypothetical protein